MTNLKMSPETMHIYIKRNKIRKKPRNGVFHKGGVIV